MSERHKKLGIKQTIQKAWMDRVVQMMLAGMSEKEIRQDLDHFLSTQKQSGGIGERGKKTYGIAIGILASWFAPDKELVLFRDNVLKYAEKLPSSQWAPLHWIILSSAYPFWWNVAAQVGRLLNLQNQITQAQIFKRLKELYGDRETVARNARYTIRSFVAWGALRDAGAKGCYEKAARINITDESLSALMFEAALHANSEGKLALRLLPNNPAFFPFELPIMTGNTIARRNDRIDVFRYGLDDELLKLKGK